MACCVVSESQVLHLPSQFFALLTTQLQAHEGGMERTARRFVDSVARDRTLNSLATEQEHRGLAPLHLLSISESHDFLECCVYLPRFLLIFDCFCVTCCEQAAQ